MFTANHVYTSISKRVVIEIVFVTGYEIKMLTRYHTISLVVRERFKIQGAYEINMNQLCGHVTCSCNNM